MTAQDFTRKGAGPVLVTGGSGFIGSNLADSLLSEGAEVIVFDNLSRPGVEQNLQWLIGRHGAKVQPIIGDVRDAEAVGRGIAEAGAVFHFAAQTAVTTSLVDPAEDFDINARGTFNVLDAVRRSGRKMPVIFASTNKVYGGLADIATAIEADRHAPADPALAAQGVDESRPLDFCTPYGCSKGAADQYVLDYTGSFGIPTAVLRMSCIYGPRQFGTEDQGWVAHFLIRALAGETISIYGDGRQVRDILHVRDAVAAYRAVLDGIDDVKGQAFNLGGGPGNAVSLKQVLAEISALAGRDLSLDFGDWRQGDQVWFVADTQKLCRALGWAPTMGWRDGVRDLANWLRENRAPATEERRAIA
ncbi:MAG TPA: SDR family NAD(P)-dependent oxidoreductase [Devosia sp.]|nr:SDR family NAD(P)-dependent oxidoreductase [Devosia sp.]